jgi:hypothetical protein
VPWCPASIMAAECRLEGPLNSSLLLQTLPSRPARWRTASFLSPCCLLSQLACRLRLADLSVLHYKPYSICSCCSPAEPGGQARPAAAVGDHHRSQGGARSGGAPVVQGVGVQPPGEIVRPPKGRFRPAHLGIHQPARFEPPPDFEPPASSKCAGEEPREEPVVCERGVGRGTSKQRHERASVSLCVVSREQLFVLISFGTFFEDQVFCIPSTEDISSDQVFGILSLCKSQVFSFLSCFPHGSAETEKDMEPKEA